MVKIWALNLNANYKETLRNMGQKICGIQISLTRAGSENFLQVAIILQSGFHETLTVYCYNFNKQQLSYLLTRLAMLSKNTHLSSDLVKQT